MKVLVEGEKHYRKQRSSIGAVTGGTTLYKPAPARSHCRPDA